MAGIDRTRVVNLSEELIQEFICGICLQIFVKPIITPCCLQIYCSFCIKQWLSSHLICPIERKPLMIRSLVKAPKAINNLLDKLQVKCEFESIGCQAVVKVEDISSHLVVCDFNKCETCGIKRGDFSLHNCVQNLKTKLASAIVERTKMDEKIKRLTANNKRLIEENIELEAKNRRLKLMKLPANT